MRVLYGQGNRYKDVTDIAREKCMIGTSRLIIPPEDYNRDQLFGDPWYGVVKQVIVESDAGDEMVYGPHVSIDVDVSKPLYNREDVAAVQLSKIHRSYPHFAGHLIHDELPEQLLAVMYIRPTDAVLELGANVGRNTLTISRLLNDSSRLVSLETIPDTCDILQKNKENYQLNFHIINAALSYRKLVQKNWLTVPCEDGVPLGYTPVNTITFEEIQARFPSLEFTTLVADVEGALYYILQDNPTILQTMRTVILENDYPDIEQKNEVTRILQEQGFTRVYVQKGGWGPCYNEFYEVWESKKFTTLVQYLLACET